MPKIVYTEKRFSGSRLQLIAKANEIIDEYTAQGFSLTLRQIYYQFVSRGIIPNSQREYKRLGDIINGARLAGLIDWNSIVDRTRNLQANSHWDNPHEIVETCVDQFQLDKWENQDYRVEVWIEKDALIGVIENVCRKNDVPFFSCRGYTSQSEMWSASQRLLSHDRETVIIHLGDHDPSGMDMSRDIRDRLELFMSVNGVAAEVKRIALNHDQVEKYKPPPNPAKLTDTRATVYIAEFGNKSWELDALEPKVMERLIQKMINKYRDPERWEEMKEREQEHVEALRKVSRGLQRKGL